MYNLKELYTSDTTLSQMIDWTPPSNELWGKIRSDPPPPWKSWKKLLSVRFFDCPVRFLEGPGRIYIYSNRLFLLKDHINEIRAQLQAGDKCNQKRYIIFFPTEVEFYNFVLQKQGGWTR